MRRKLTAIALPLVAALALIAGGPDGTILLDDFNDGDAEGWDQNDFTVGSPGGPGTYQVVDGEYVLGTTGFIPVDDPSVGTVESHWEGAEGKPRFANGVIRGVIRAEADGTTIGFTVRDNDEAESGYDFVGSTSLGTFYIDRYDLGANPDAPQTIIAVADPSRFPFVVGEAWNVEAGFVGHNLWMKVWRVGDLEPETPALRVTDKGLEPESGSGIAVVVYFDPFALGPGVTGVRPSGAFDNVMFTPGAKRWGRLLLAPGRAMGAGAGRSGRSNLLTLPGYRTGAPDGFLARPPFSFPQHNRRTWIMDTTRSFIAQAACSWSRTAVLVMAGVLGAFAGSPVRGADDLDTRLAAALVQAGFTGRVESTLPRRLGRPVDRDLADLGRLLFFDRITGLHNDNACAGCHSPTNGFGDTQSIAVGIQNNNRVGPGRVGPRNQRRTPMLINNAFYPRLMWNVRFSARSGDPFDNSAGFRFPEPEGTTRFPPGDPGVYHLLVAQAHIPPTEQVEAAGFTGTGGIFDDGLGSPLPDPDPLTGSRNEPIRRAVLDRLNATPNYRSLFGARYPSVRRGGPIDFVMFGQAIAEFEFTLTFADAPIDRFARGDRAAMTRQEKRGALLFFGEAGCVRCHAVAGPSNEMFSDFQMHVLGVPQVAPVFGVGTGNIAFSGPGADEDFGLEEFTGDPEDRYKFRTSPLRNLAMQPAFFHNGSFTRLEDAVAHHLNVVRSARQYDPVAAGLAPDLTLRQGPLSPVLRRLDPLVRTPTPLSRDEFDALIAFLRVGLLDPRATPDRLRILVPPSVPSGLPTLDFEF